MLKLRFRIDKHHLAYRLWNAYFFEKKLSDPQWTALFKEIEKEHGAHAAYCYFDPRYLASGLCWAGFGGRTGVRLIRDEGGVRRIFEDIFASEAFGRKLRELSAYQKSVEAQRKKNRPWLKELEKITGLPMDGSFEVLLLSPDLETGSYLGFGQIEWGCSEAYPGYYFIGLCHEALHGLTQKRFQASQGEDERWRLHALICLAADEELRKRAFGGEYFDAPAPYLGNRKLGGMVRKMLPEWKTHLASGGGRGMVDFL